MRRLDNTQTDTWLKVAITGFSGTGKTTFAATAPHPLILLSEYQGMSSIETWVADGKGRDRPIVLFMETVQDYRNVVAALHGPKDQPFTIRDKQKNVIEQFDVWPETVVIDSLTDALTIVRDEVLAEAPPSKDKLGLPDESFAHKRIITDRCTKLIRSFRNVPVNVVFLCLLDEKDIYVKQKKVGQRWTPQVPSKDLVGVITAAVNVAGVSYRKLVASEDGKSAVVKYAIRTQGPEWMPVKNMKPLRDYEVPDFSKWIKMVRGFWKGPLPEAPPPSDDLELEEETPRQHREEVALQSGRRAQVEGASDDLVDDLQNQVAPQKNRGKVAHQGAESGM